MSGRLIIAIITTLLDEILIIFLLVWGLPKLGIHLPIALLVLIGVLWTSFAVMMYVFGSKILRKKPVTGFTDMSGCKGKVVKSLSPEGMIKIDGELWKARTNESPIGVNEEVEVLSQNRLILTVKRLDSK
jgi:membrane-bound ClpP family serine protease